MKTARLASIFATLLLPSLIAAQTLPGQLPGQKPPGQLPGMPAKPATAAPPAATARPLPSCCSITEINKTMGFVHAREKNGGRTIEIKATTAQMLNLHVGQDVFANLDTRKASFDGRTICCDLTIVPLASAITAAQPIPKLDPVTNAGSEKIEVGDVSYELRLSGGSQLLHSGTFPDLNFGQRITIFVALRNTGTTTLSNVQWKVYETSGSAPFDSGVQTLPTLAPSGSGYTLGKVSWKLVEGSHRFVAVIDPNNKIPEAAESRLNNSRILDLTVGPQMQSLQLDPKAAGAPGSVVTNMQDSNGCKANVTLRSASLVIDLYAPNPLPIPFAGCSMKPEFYKGAQLNNGWQVSGVQLKEATNHFPPPPTSMWGWLKKLGGDSLYGQTFLSLPSRSTSCSAGEFCGTSISTELMITIQGRAASSSTS